MPQQPSVIDIYLDDFTPTSVLKGKVVFADLPAAEAHLEVLRQTARIAELVVRRDVAVQGTPQPFVIDCGQPISPLDLLTRRIEVRLLQSGSPITLRLSEALVRRLAETQFVVPLFEESFSPDPLSRLHRTVREFKREDILSLPETPLCKLMKASGSDKAGDWHNYTLLYERLLAELRDERFDLLEIGIGTNHPDVPSSMGPSGVPGASLRAWRAFFPNASIYGADVDRRILFTEERITTLYVDQTSPEAVDAMWSELPSSGFKLIIDDGLHQLEANRTLLAHSIERLAPGGYYIIEDVAVNAANLVRFRDFLWSIGLPSCLVALRHPRNNLDNCLAIIHRPG